VYIRRYGDVNIRRWKERERERDAERERILYSKKIRNREERGERREERGERERECVCVYVTEREAKEKTTTADGTKERKSVECASLSKTTTEKPVSILPVADAT
jgi:hypothetical protein